jgi:hypothetical protein
MKIKTDVVDDLAKLSTSKKYVFIGKGNNDKLIRFK